MSNWVELDSKGWSKERYPNTQIYYKKPPENGMRKTVRRKSDLNENEQDLIPVLFPPAAKKIKSSGSRSKITVSEVADPKPRDGDPVVMDMTEGETGTDQAKKINHKELLLKVAAELKEFSKSTEVLKDGMFNVVKSIEDLSVALKYQSHPFKEFPDLETTNFFVSTINFAKQFTKELLFMIISHTVGKNADYEPKTVVLIAKTYLAFASAMNPQVNTAWKKVMTVTMQACRTTKTGIDILAMLGECETSRSLQNIKSVMAVKDEENTIEIASLYSSMFVFDNINQRINKVTHNATLPMIVWSNRQLRMMLPADDSMNHDDKVDLFNEDFFNLSSNQNTELRSKLMLVIHTIMAKLCAETIPDCEWMLDHLPTHHDHDFKEVGETETEYFVQCVLNLDEMVGQNMNVILETILWRFLFLLGHRLQEDEKQKYWAAMVTMRRPGIEPEELEEAEKTVDSVVLRFGKCIIYGDQLSVDSAQDSFESRKIDATMFERFEWILVLWMGDLHIQMSGCTKHHTALYPVLSSVDPCTMGRFATDLGRSHLISNDDKKIKKCGNY